MNTMNTPKSPKMQFSGFDIVQSINKSLFSPFSHNVPYWPVFNCLITILLKIENLRIYNVEKNQNFLSILCLNINGAKLSHTKNILTDKFYGLQHQEYVKNCFFVNRYIAKRVMSGNITVQKANEDHSHIFL